MARSLKKEPMIIPNKYDGLWSAYYVEIIFHNGNKSHKIKLDAFFTKLSLNLFNLIPKSYSFSEFSVFKCSS
jgi:hypothetical protein